MRSRVEFYGERFVCDNKNSQKIDSKNVSTPFSLGLTKSKIYQAREPHVNKQSVRQESLKLLKYVIIIDCKNSKNIV